MTKKHMMLYTVINMCESVKKVMMKGQDCTKYHLIVKKMNMKMSGDIILTWILIMLALSVWQIKMIRF